MSAFQGVLVPLGPGSTFPATGSWYVVPALGIAVPVADGHYSWQPTNGVSLQAPGRSVTLDPGLWGAATSPPQTFIGGAQPRKCLG
jgi:hypothetical protein